MLLQFFPGFDGKTSITLWIVMAKKETSDTYSHIYNASSPLAREIWVENLKPYTRYRLKLVARNVVGESAPSEPTSEFETLQAPPAVPPGDVTARAINATAVRIGWTVSYCAFPTIQ